MKRHYSDWIDDDGDSERKEVGLLCSVAENCWTNCAAVEQEMSRGNETARGNSGCALAGRAYICAQVTVILQMPKIWGRDMGTVED